MHAQLALSGLGVDFEVLDCCMHRIATIYYGKLPHGLDRVDNCELVMTPAMDCDEMVATKR